MTNIINGRGRVGVRSNVSNSGGGAGGGIVTNGLILNLDAGNTSSYPGVGTTWTDLSGNGNNGTLINGVGYSSSNGGTLVFDGSNDYAEISTNGSHIPNLTECTYNFFVNFNNFSKSYNQLAETFSTDLNYQFSPLVKSNGKLAFYIFNTLGNQSSYDGTGIYTLVTNTWYMLSFVFKGGVSQKAYVNGLLDGSAPSPVSSMTSSTQNLRIGSSIFDARFPAVKMSTFQVYNRALTESEITQNFDALKSRYGL